LLWTWKPNTFHWPTMVISLLACKQKNCKYLIHNVHKQRHMISLAAEPEVLVLLPITWEFSCTNWKSISLVKIFPFWCVSRRKKLLTGGVNFMLPQGNMENVDNIFRKATPNSRYCHSWGNQNPLKLALLRTRPWVQFPALQKKSKEQKLTLG
jgi:hypothetical protein